MAKSKVNVQLVAARVLREVIDRGKSLDQTLVTELVKLPPERGPRLQELGYGSCRHYALLNGILGQLLAKPIRNKDRIIHFLLVIGLYQLEYLRIPDHAAVDETVAALRHSRQSWARGLVNGVLREYIRLRGSDRLAAMHASLTPAARAGFTDYLFEAIRKSWPEQADSIFAASTSRPPMTLRVNRQRSSRQAYLDLLAAHGVDAKPTSDSGDGVNLNQPMTVTGLPHFEDGWVSVQDESAQLCTGLLELEGGNTVLDTCAAPGGKTCAMLEAVPSINLTAVDLPERVGAIRENLSRIGLQAEVRESGLHATANWPGERTWQRILMDVPCSGSGVIRRHPDILHRRRDGDLQRFASQQLELMHLAWPLLAPGGLLLYCTCSILSEENDQVIDQFMTTCSDGEIRPVKGFTGIQTKNGRQRLPGVHSGDGFYYCLIGKL